MDKLGYGALALVAFVSCLVFASSAEARWAPTGSYERTCNRINFDGDTLTASCQRRDGSWRNTWLPNADDCDSSIVNNNGQLECANDRRGYDRSDNDGGPSGSYERSCTNIHMDGYVLRAMCQRRDGSWRWSTLDDAYNCDGHVANYNGNLVCDRHYHGHY